MIKFHGYKLSQEFGFGITLDYRASNIYWTFGPWSGWIDIGKGAVLRGDWTRY